MLRTPKELASDIDKFLKAYTPDTYCGEFDNKEYSDIMIRDFTIGDEYSIRAKMSILKGILLNEQKNQWRGTPTDQKKMLIDLVNNINNYGLVVAINQYNEKYNPEAPKISDVSDCMKIEEFEKDGFYLKVEYNPKDYNLTTTIVDGDYNLIKESVQKMEPIDLQTILTRKTPKTFQVMAFKQLKEVLGEMKR